MLVMEDFKLFISYMKEKGIIYPGSEIYGGLANSWDYGPLGSLIKDNIKDLWKSFFIFGNNHTYLMDSSIILNNKVWNASGHLNKFNDYVIESLNDNKRYRVDKLLKEYLDINFLDYEIEEVEKLIKEKIKLPKYKDKTKWGNVKKFNLMFEINSSKTTDEDKLYLRPETAQGIFINFKNIVDTIYPKLPFAVGQIGKSFRNEVTPGNFIFKTKEFEQLELEYFIYPETSNEIFQYCKDNIEKFLFTKLKIKKDNIKVLNVPKNELAHYSKKTIDFEYQFPFGKEEILGLSNRGDYDLKVHKDFSKEKINYQDPKTNKKIIPHVIEHSMGLQRLMLVILLEGFKKHGNKQLLKLPYKLAPYKLAILPLTKEENEIAWDLYLKIQAKEIGSIKFMTNGNIGKRYKKLDEIGTPFVLTVDKESKKDNAFTIRHWNNEKQDRIILSELENYIKKYAK